MEKDGYRESSVNTDIYKYKRDPITDSEYIS